MKKKLLSLVLAGAMVASTSVSAFAENKPYEVAPGVEREVEVKVEGNVSAHDGTVLPSTVTVTVPTNAAFKVDEKGTLTSATMNIENRGDSAVSVIASEFVDSNGDLGISVVNEANLGTDNRSKVALKLTGGNEEIVLTSENKGTMYKSDGRTKIEKTENFVIGEATKDRPLSLTLAGKGVAAKGSDKAIQDNFKLVLKIKQASKQVSNPGSTQVGSQDNTHQGSM